MRFNVDRCEKLGITDEEISALLSEVYVGGGYTDGKTAEKVFEPGAVRRRGTLFGAREGVTDAFAGMVVVVPPSSGAVVLAGEDECEIHLLGVRPEFRHRGAGEALMRTALAFVHENGWSKTVLWTQKPMTAAQKLYESLGFVKTGLMDRNGIAFIVYERKTPYNMGQ